MERFSLKEYLKDPDRKIITRDKSKVRIICTNHKNKIYPIVALVGENEDILSFTTNGSFCSDCPNSDKDLFFAPEKHSRWMFLFRSPNVEEMIFASDAYRYKSNAEEAMEKLNGFGLTEITWEE